MNVKHHSQHMSVTTGSPDEDGFIPVFITSNLDYRIEGGTPQSETHHWRLDLDPAHWCGDPLQMVQNVLHRAWIEMREVPRLQYPWRSKD